MDFLAKVVLNLLRSLFLFNRATEKNTDPCTKAGLRSGWYIAVGENASRADVVASDRVEAFFKGLGIEMKLRRSGFITV